MALEIDRKTWLNFADLLQYDDGTVFWDTPNFPEIVPQEDDTFVSVDDLYTGRLDLIAYDQYNDVNLWWVIALANKIDRVPSGVTLGMTLRIPNKRYLDTLFSKGRQ